MRSFFVVAFTIGVILVAAANPAVAGGSIRGSSIKILRRYLLDEDNNEEGEDNKCKDTPGQIQTGGGEDGNETFNCRKIKRNGLCEKKHVGKHLYESCQKSCDICEEEFETTDAPTGDLLNLDIELEIKKELEAEGGVYESPSATPTQSPINPLTNTPTEYPSAYPTTQPSTLVPTDIALLSVTDEPTIEAIFDIDFELEFDTPVPETATPTLSPTTPFTDTPTESPSRYPTVAPTVDMLAGMFEDLDDES